MVFAKNLVLRTTALGLGMVMLWVAVIPTHALTTILLLEIHKLGLYLLVMCQQMKIVRLEIRLVATLPTHALVLSIRYGVQILAPWVAVLTGTVFMTRLVYRERITMQKSYQDRHQQGRYRQVHLYRVVVATPPSSLQCSVAMEVQQKAE